MAELQAINSAWPCPHMQVVYWNLPIMFPPAYESTGCNRSICCAPISPVTTQRQSIVLWQTHFQGHIITVLDTVQAILVTTEQTGTGSAAISLYGKREIEIFFYVSLHNASARGMKTWLSFSDTFRCGKFKLAASTAW